MAAFTVLDGGASLSAEQADHEWKAAWATIADACEQALSDLHPTHPRRTVLLEATRNAHLAAGRPSMPSLRGA